MEELDPLACSQVLPAVTAVQNSSSLKSTPSSKGTASAANEKFVNTIWFQLYETIIKLMQFLRISGGILYLQQMDWVAYVAALVCKYRPQYRVDIVELLADKTVLELKIVAVAFFIP